MLTRILHAPEAFVLRVTLVAIVADAALILLRGATVDLRAYGLVLALVALLLGIGYAYRRSRRSEAIGATTIGAGLFILFTSALSLFNYLLLPNPNPTIDTVLAGWDAMLGYDWPSILAWAARHPWFNEFMRFAYMSTLAQIALLVVVLGLTSRIGELHAMMVTVTVAGTMTILFWAIFPAIGPSAMYAVPPELLAKVRPLVGPDYGRELASLISDGPSILSPDDVRGLIAFPSFHTVLALVSIYYARTVKWLLPVLVPVNLAVLPAVLVHGGHHLVDIGGGFAVLALALLCGRRTQPAGLPAATTA